MRALGLSPKPSGGRFSDVRAEDWYDGYIGAAAKVGLIKGRDGGRIAPLDNATRAEAIVIIKRLLEYTGGV